MPTGLYGQEFEPEEGLEEEGFLDVVKPYKRKATAYLREKGMPVAADVVDMIGPDSPGDLLPTGKGMSALGMAKGPAKGLSIPSKAMGDNLPEVQKQMTGLRNKIQDLRNTPPPTAKALERFNTNIQGVEMIKRSTPDSTLWRMAKHRSPLKDYPKDGVDKLLSEGKAQEAKALHDSFKDVGTDSFGLAFYDKQADKIQKAFLDEMEGP